ncbi:heparinase II/III domain-containing protein [Streptomyces sp. ME19-01-6]|uniref:heparinase II/III domain-containing protein n=1 Tax=Streptomyces sp. ME19-01-6 TaxID=3028686 RepID=UPI0029AAFE8D|nr:heparinase II/III family protein [Streptomyces sp. ME19-01-6]MDX3231083.1 heparinase II/III family protein [Streptomyces sp. ME19-01-6]
MGLVEPVSPAYRSLRNRLGPALHPASAPGSRPDPLVELLRDAPTRLPVPEVSARSVWEAVDAATREGLLDEAAAELHRTAPVLTASDWARTFRDGVRTAYEDSARRLRERATLFVLAATLTGEVAPADAPPGAAPYLDAAADALMALAETSTWCWAPHDRFATARGEVLPDPDEPFVDLGAAEVASLLAWADHVLGPHLDIRIPGLRRRLRREVDLRVLTPFEHTRDWHWIGLDEEAHNWNPWIHGAVLAAALLLAEDEERRARLVRLVIEGLDHYLAVLPDDGGIDEGVAYWWQGACRLLEALDLLADAGGAALDARDLPVFGPLSKFPHRMHLAGDWYVNAGDAPARLWADQPWHVLFQWGERLADPDVRAHALACARGGPAVRAVRPRAGLGRALAGLCDPHWQRALATPSGGDGGPAPWAARETWLPRVQVLVAREAAGTAEGLTLAAKAGHNGERHNHLDVGSYWVALDGRPLVVDVGQPTYTAASFGPDRYQAWPLRSAWHNVPEPGAAQQPGAAHRADDVRVDLTSAAAALHAELAGAYPAGLLRGWRRSLRLVRATAGAPAHVLVEDHWTPHPAAPVLLRHVLAGDVELGEGRAQVTADGHSLLITWDPERATPELEHRHLDDPLLRESWGEQLTRLTLTVAAPSAGEPFAVRLERSR